MSDGSEGQNNSGAKPRSEGSGRNVRIILLTLAVVVAGLALYIALKPPPKPQADVTQPPDQGQKVIASADRLIRDAQDPAIGDELRIASFRKARDLLYAYNRNNQGNTDVLLLLADVSIKLCRLHVGDAANLLAQADQSVDRVLQVAPNSSRGLWLKGEAARLRGGNYMDYFAQAADSPASEWQTWVAYAEELLKQGKVEQAGKYIDRAVSAAPTGPAAKKLLLARAELAFAQAKYDQAAGLFRQVVDMDMNDKASWLMLAVSTKRSADSAATLKVINEAIDSLRNKVKGELFFMKGSILADQKNWKDASAAFVAAAADQAVRTHASLEAARCFYELGRYSTAMGYLDTATQQLPKDDPDLKALAAKIEDARFGQATAPSQPKK